MAKKSIKTVKKAEKKQAVESLSVALRTLLDDLQYDTLGATKELKKISKRIVSHLPLKPQEDPEEKPTKVAETPTETKVPKSAVEEKKKRATKAQQTATLAEKAKEKAPAKKNTRASKKTTKTTPDIV